MERIKRAVHKFNSHEEAEAWNVEQYASMTPEERQEIALDLRRHAYGNDVPDVRQGQKGS